MPFLIRGLIYGAGEALRIVGGFQVKDALEILALGYRLTFCSHAAKGAGCGFEEDLSLGVD